MILRASFKKWKKLFFSYLFSARRRIQLLLILTPQTSLLGDALARRLEPLLAAVHHRRGRHCGQRLKDSLLGRPPLTKCVRPSVRLPYMALEREYARLRSTEWLREISNEQGGSVDAPFP